MIEKTGEKFDEIADKLEMLAKSFLPHGWTIRKM